MKSFLRIVLIISIIPLLLMGGEKKYDKSIKFNTLVFNYDKIDKESKNELKKIIKEIKKYKANSKKMKIEISAYSNDVGDDNADYVKDVLVDNKLKKKTIKFRSFYLKDENDSINNIKIVLYVNFEKDKDNDGVLIEVDKCPETPEGYEVDVDGCKIPDKDQDGVMIDYDECPDTPLGYEVGVDGCKILDKDRDGVKIDDDKCPETPFGFEVDSDGCKIPDRDQDGILIDYDKCPNTPMGVKVGTDGCKVKSVMLMINSNQTITIIKETSKRKLDKKKVHTLYYNKSGFDQESAKQLESLILNQVR